MKLLNFSQRDNLSHLRVFTDTVQQGHRYYLAREHTFIVNAHLEKQKQNKDEAPRHPKDPPTSHQNPLAALASFTGEKSRYSEHYSFLTVRNARKVLSGSNKLLISPIAEPRHLFCIKAHPLRVREATVQEYVSFDSTDSRQK